MILVCQPSQVWKRKRVQTAPSSEKTQKRKKKVNIDYSIINNVSQRLHSFSFTFFLYFISIQHYDSNNYRPEFDFVIIKRRPHFTVTHNKLFHSLPTPAITLFYSLLLPSRTISRNQIYIRICSMKIVYTATTKHIFKI